MGASAFFAATYLVVSLLTIANSHHIGDAENLSAKRDTATRETQDNINKPRNLEVDNPVASLREYVTNKFEEPLRARLNFDGGYILKTNNYEMSRETRELVESVLNKLSQLIEHAEKRNNKDIEDTVANIKYGKHTGFLTKHRNRETTVTDIQDDQNEIPVDIEEVNVKDTNAKTTEAIYLPLGEDNDDATAKNSAGTRDFKSNLGKPTFANPPNLYLVRQKRQYQHTNNYVTTNYTKPQINLHRPIQHLNGSAGNITYHKHNSSFSGTFHNGMRSSNNGYRYPHNGNNITYNRHNSSYNGTFQNGTRASNTSYHYPHNGYNIKGGPYNITHNRHNSSYNGKVYNGTFHNGTSRLNNSYRYSHNGNNIKGRPYYNASELHNAKRDGNAFVYTGLDFNNYRTLGLGNVFSNTSYPVHNSLS